MFSDYNSGIDSKIIFYVIFLGLPVILFNIFNLAGVKNKAARFLSYSSAFLILPYTLMVDNLREFELDTNRNYTIGIVKEAWMRRIKSRHEWTVNAVYQVNDIEYVTSDKVDDTEKLNVGDTVTIIYSSNIPEVSEILEFKFNDK